MDSAIGVTGKDFAMVACSASVHRSILAYKHDEDKIYRLDNSKLLATTGDQASRTSFAEFIEANMALQRISSDVEMSTEATAHYIRRTLARALRSRQGAFQCNSILAGVDPDGTVGMYHLDYLGSLQKVDFTAHGYASNFALSIMDKNFQKNLTKQEAKAILVACINQLKLRFLVNMPRFVLKTVSRDGIEEEIVEV